MTTETYVVIVREDDKHYYSAQDADSAETAMEKYGSTDGQVMVGAFPLAFGSAGGWYASLRRPEFDSMSLQMVAAWTRERSRSASAAPRKPAPQLIPEVWQPERPDPQRAWDAVMALCKGQ